MPVTILEEKKVRVIVNTDAKNEVDDQFAIVHALLSPSFRMAGIIPAHFGKEKSLHSMEDSRQEVDLLLDMLRMKGTVRVENGAPVLRVEAHHKVKTHGLFLFLQIKAVHLRHMFV